MTKLWQQIFQYSLGAIITLSLLSTIMILIRSELSPSVHDALMILVGVEASAFTAVVSYFFGSSKGSSDKTEMLKNNPPKDPI